MFVAIQLFLIALEIFCAAPMLFAPPIATLSTKISLGAWQPTAASRSASERPESSSGWNDWFDLSGTSVIGVASARCCRRMAASASYIC